MNDRSKKIFTEMAQEVMNREKVNIGDYEVDVDLLEDWNMCKYGYFGFYFHL